MSEELAYSIHLGSDKNKTKKARETAKKNMSGTTSNSNNAIQNSVGLSKVNKHNLRDYDNDREMIQIIYGSDNLYKDVQKLYLQEFEDARIEYNNKQSREDRKINDYFKHISDSKLWDLACQFIIELGDMDFWNDKDITYRKQMSEVYKLQINDLAEVIPEFKIANAVVHFEETSKSPHLHIVGIPVSENNKRGMKKQVAKSKIFTKESLKQIQDEMRSRCIKEYNQVFQKMSTLKQKQKGRNHDIAVKDMINYREIKKQYDKKAKQLIEANKRTEKLDVKAEILTETLHNLKASPFNKNNKLISNENVEELKKIAEQIKDTTKSVRSVNDLNITIKEFEHTIFEVQKENRSLKYQVESKDEEIRYLKSEIDTKDKVVNKLHAEKENLKMQLRKFKSFWHSIIKRFQEKICFDNDINYKEVSKDLYKVGIFDENEEKIVNDISRIVKPSDKWKIKRKVEVK